ncbi:MAG: large conductance mechanosensitive channel protein MscL [Clostridia bacterium]|nr:large conductance mechanosensitive channel protein MscL [Clostridia bacterium]
MGKFWADFKTFITRGNVVDMAVGVVVGGAFGKITTGLVQNIVTPVISLLVGGLNINDWKVVLKEAVINPETQEVITAETAILYGTFIQTIIDFLVTAFAIFLVLRIIMKVKEKVNAKEMAEAAEKKAAEDAAAKEKADAEAAVKAEAEAKVAAEREEELRLLREIAASLKK